jgi:uncharacterized protein (TIGR02246 family)
MQMMTRIVSIVTVLILGGAGTAAAQKPDAEMQKLTEQYAAAVNKGDGKAVAALYTADAVRLGPDGQVIVGQAAIEKQHVASLTGPQKGAKLTLRPGRTQTVTPDVVITEGTYELTGGSAPAKGKYVNTVVRQGGQWRLASVVAVPETSATK